MNARERCAECGVVIALVGCSNSDPDVCSLCVFAAAKTSERFWSRIAQGHVRTGRRSARRR